MRQDFPRIQQGIKQSGTFSQQLVFANTLAIMYIV